MKHKIYLLLVALFIGCLGFAQERKTYPNKTHKTSHGGTYRGGKGSSHKGGKYTNPRTNNKYGKHKK